MEFTCLVEDIHFYLYILIIIGVLMILYILANLYTLLWILIRPMRKLGRFLGTLSTLSYSVASPNGLVLLGILNIHYHNHSHRRHDIWDSYKQKDQDSETILPKFHS